ncbi:hypothetical protein [Pseudoalteromonas luteoviolacea]|uniref:Uncharacterized protein n=1 Tax=Pseudoalteromonas luteoviolacea S4060-1 TaxID=1365257 RepID=A0A162CGX2_9GAMM|nr:hypothetical protein [Pseudoalteromonas luteoviolacea]KZN67700.1 hypothetical protein N478_02765 [Pseudoalteromonas luteoviolacea S4060-1]
MENRTALINELEYRQRAESSRLALRKLLFLLGLVIFILASSLFSSPEFFFEFYRGRPFYDKSEIDAMTIVNFKIFGGGLAVLSTVIFAYLYMVGFNPIRMHRKANLETTENNADSFKNESIAIVALLKSIDASLEKGKIESTLSKAERKEIINSISNTVESHLNESLLNKIEEKYGTTVHSSKLSELALSSLDKTVKRLSEYANDLQNKASVNLGYGISATVIAICILIFVLFNATAPESSTTIQEVFYYSSRLFLVLLVQGISIFFLNLYKSTINNVLYLSNEITNHEAKRDSISIALSSGNFDAASSMLLSLSNTERNFTLKKGETSIYDKGGAAIQAPISETLISDLLNKFNADKNVKA